MVLLICLTGVSLLIGLVVYLVGRRRNNNTNGTKEEPLIVKKYTYV
jgi:dipeptide/tripeptide permease